MTHWEVLGKVFFSEFYADTVSDCLSKIDTSVSEDVSSSGYYSDSDDGKLEQQKDKKNLVIDSDKESENEMVENAPVLLQKTGLRTAFPEN